MKMYIYWPLKNTDNVYNGPTNWFVTGKSLFSLQPLICLMTITDIVQIKIVH